MFPGDSPADPPLPSLAPGCTAGTLGQLAGGSCARQTTRTLPSEAFQERFSVSRSLSRSKGTSSNETAETTPATPYSYSLFPTPNSPKRYSQDRLSHLSHLPSILSSPNKPKPWRNPLPPRDNPISGSSGPFYRCKSPRSQRGREARGE